MPRLKSRDFLLDPVRGHALLSPGQGRLPKGDLPGFFLLPRQAVPPWGECNPKKVHTVLRQPAQAFILVPNPVLQSHGALPCPRLPRQKKGNLKFKSKLLSLDCSTITLCLSLFPWAEYKRVTGEDKTHIMLDHNDYMPSFVLPTEAKVADVTMAQGLALNPGSILVLD
ncbi:hypothetical protein DFAR_670016 [Desulfarculales bacterium]